MSQELTSSLAPTLQSAGIATPFRTCRTKKLLLLLVVDAVGVGFVVSLEALNNVTNGEAMELGSIAAFVDQMPNGECSA